jgi:hypothetical protein
LITVELGMVGVLLSPRVLMAAEPSDSPQISSEQEKKTKKSTYHRYAFVAAGALGVGGLIFGFIAHGQQERAKTLSSAAETTKALDDARQSAATANVLYAVAGATLVYALVLEFLPEPAAEKASGTFHF